MTYSLRDHIDGHMIGGDGISNSRDKNRSTSLRQSFCFSTSKSRIDFINKIRENNNFGFGKCRKGGLDACDYGSIL